MTGIDHIHPLTRFGKRALDVTGAAIGLALTLPLFPVIAAAIRAEGEGPILYRQTRVGEIRDGRTRLFDMVKFRTMRVDAESSTGAIWSSEDDPRITRVGRFLRKTRLDELPQLWNVLAGEMSLVGPRPERPGIVEKLDAAIPFYAERMASTRPGITGLAQVFQGYDRTLDDVRSKIGYDHAYAAALSNPAAWVAMDLMILWRTVAVMVGARGR